MEKPGSLKRALVQVGVVLMLTVFAVSEVIAQFAEADPLRTMPPALKAMQSALFEDPSQLERWPSAELHGADLVFAEVLRARAESRRARPEPALSMLQAVEAEARKLEDVGALLTLLETRASIELDFVRFDDCDQSIRALLAIAEQRGLTVWHARALALRGGYWRRLGDYEQALGAHRSALDLRERVGDRFGQVDSLNAIALLQRRAGELYQALDGHTKALRIAEAVNYRYAMAESQRLIARIYSELDDYEQAERFYLSALDVSDPRDEQLKVDLLLELASVKVQFNQLDEAERLSDQAIAIGRTMQGEAYTGVGYLRRAQILNRRGASLEALRWIDETIKLGERSDGARTIMVKRAARQQALKELGRNREAVVEGEAVIAMARKVGDRLIERDTLKTQAQALFDVGDAKQAFQAMARYSELNAEVASSMTSRRIADLEASLKRRALESELGLAEKERDLSRLESERQRWALLAAVAMTITLIAALAFLIVHARRVRAVNLKLKHASETDLLTGLPNRRAVATLIEKLKSSDGQRIAVLLLDIDHFKRINDTQGHAGGDDVLREFALRLRQVCEPPLTVSRWGGEEFLMFGALSPSGAAVDTASMARELAIKTLEVIRSKPMRAGEQSITVTASIGLAMADRQVLNSERGWELILQAADTALYEAKVAGRDQLRVAH